ncbi:MAG: glycosyltransferase family 4 protein [Planctomycetes bacterium]|nr:glycosyltransferase family 4 protein [Planctomycetota bacterium]
MIMKIALITTSFLPAIGGAEFVVHHLAQQWSLQGHNVCVFNSLTDEIYHPDANYSVKKYRLIRGGKRFGFHRHPFCWQGVRCMKNIIKDYQPDFISAHFGYPIAVWLSKITSCPKWLITCHGAALKTYERNVRRRFKVDDIIANALSRSNGTVAISRFVRNAYEELGVDSSKIVDIPHGVDFERFQVKAKANIRDKFQIRQNAMIVLSVGRDEFVKDYESSIRAFSQVAKNIANVYYLIIGHKTNRFRPLTEELGISDRVIFCEGLYDDELVAAYQQSDMFFSASYAETFGLVNLEAMAAGLPLIITRADGTVWPAIPDTDNPSAYVDGDGYEPAVIDGVNGLVANPHNVDEMADAILKLLNDEKNRKQMGNYSHTKAKRYDWNRISKIYLQ